MKFRPYPKYKPSGIEWIGDVPEGWKVVTLKYVVSMRSGEQITAEQIGSNGEYPVFGGNGLRGYTSSFTHDGFYALIGRQGALCGNVNYAKGKFWASEHAVVVSPLVECSTVWLGELLRTMDLGQYSITAAQPGLSVEAISKLQVPLPPTDTQSDIAAFLAGETAKIDTLIDKHENLIKLLKEKRQVVISHAVTKGLDPTAPMKPSGVEWLGDVPEHWNATKLSYVTSLISDGAHFTPTYCDDGVPFLRVTDIQNYPIDLGAVKRIPFEEHLELCKRAHAKKGDLLLSKNGTIGIPRIVDWDWDFSFFVSLCVIRFSETVLSDFAKYLFLSEPIKAQMADGSKQSAVTNLHLEQIRSFRMTLPPVQEQSCIVRYLDVEVEKVDALIAKAEQAIILQKEHRAALISNAVTGKIDVREAASKFQEAA